MLLKEIGNVSIQILLYKIQKQFIREFQFLFRTFLQQFTHQVVQGFSVAGFQQDLIIQPESKNGPRRYGTFSTSRLFQKSSFIL